MAAHDEPRWPRWSAGPRGPPHPFAGIGWRLGRRDDPRARGRVPGSTSSRSPTTSGSTPRSRRGPWPSKPTSRSRSSSGRRSRHAAATSSASSCASASGPGSRSVRASRRSTTRAGSRSSRIRSSRTRSVRAPGRSGDCSTPPTRPSTRTRSRPSTRPPRGCAGAGGCPRSPKRSGWRRSPRPTHIGRPRSGVRTRRSRARAAADLRAAIEARDTGWGGEAYTWREQVGTFGRQLERYASGARDDLRGIVRRDGSGRDLGYPGGRARPPRFDPSSAGQPGRERP